jgi:hypothetical protein
MLCSNFRGLSPPVSCTARPVWMTALASLELEAKASPLDALQADDSSALSKWLCGGIESIGRRGSSAAVAPTPRDPNVNIITKDGGMGEERLLLVAVRLNAGKCVSYLVQAGADVNFAGMNGYTVRNHVVPLQFHVDGVVIFDCVRVSAVVRRTFAMSAGVACGSR